VTGEWCSLPFPKEKTLTSKNQNKKSTVTSTRAPQTSSQIRREIQRELARAIEIKVSHQNTAGGVSYNGTIHNCIGSLTKGDGPFAATGNLLRPKSLTVRGSVNTDQTYNSFRIILFRWKDASTPLPSGLLDQVSTAYAPLSAPYWVNVHKMEILEDRLIALKTRNTVGFDNKTFVIHHNFPPSAPSIQLPDSAGPGMVAQMNGLYILFISDDAIATLPTVYCRSELRFTDA